MAYLLHVTEDVAQMLAALGLDGQWRWRHDLPQSIGKVRSYYGNIGVLVRALRARRAKRHLSVALGAGPLCPGRTRPADQA